MANINNNSSIIFYYGEEVTVADGSKIVNATWSHITARKDIEIADGYNNVISVNNSTLYVSKSFIIGNNNVIAGNGNVAYGIGCHDVGDNNVIHNRASNEMDDLLIITQLQDSMKMDGITSLSWIENMMAIIEVNLNRSDFNRTLKESTTNRVRPNVSRVEPSLIIPNNPNRRVTYDIPPQMQAALLYSMGSISMSVTPMMVKQTTPPAPRMERSRTQTSTNDSNRDENCVVCLERKPTHVFVSCWHMCICEGCVASLRQRRIDKCPMCNVRYERIQKIFR